MEGIDAVQGQGNLLESWQNAQNVQLALAAAVMKQGQDMAEMEGEAVLKLLDSMPRTDGTGQLVQKSA
jgi:predicted ATPase